jgi:hypothetical protein
MTFLSIFGLSQFGLLHFGQTLGVSPLSRDSHSWPHRHRQPHSHTIPISLLVDFLDFTIPVSNSKFTSSIYDCSSIVKLQVVSTDCSNGDGRCLCKAQKTRRVCRTGGRWIGSIVVCRSLHSRRSIRKVGLAGALTVWIWSLHGMS